ncbi:hypothetical protein [Ornithinimicrobium sp. INDO-MA30-4]|uniref:hypothetical protein n=1 Tax=Ornithinimicrobium sp. INDO-MA30-4 TaxID=2908651 RepID=UPI001F3D1D56|nr:hypothetical protein [Ornithinimicrobium sp. INDO-MA30-4]UJH70209.1 hypothetical protein L0A91_13690 [Ornithinimicrobium sp. INDO-MA30-4]
MTYQVGIVAVPESDAGPSEDMQAVAELQHRVHMQESGHDDWGSSAESISKDYASQQYTGKIYALARIASRRWAPWWPGGIRLPIDPSDTSTWLFPTSTSRLSSPMNYGGSLARRCWPAVPAACSAGSPTMAK